MQKDNFESERLVIKILFIAGNKHNKRNEQMTRLRILLMTYYSLVLYFHYTGPVKCLSGNGAL